MQANATTNPKKCHNKCKEMPQQMQRNATINAQKCHNKCKEMPQQMQRNATRNATTNAGLQMHQTYVEVNVATYVYLFLVVQTPLE